MIKTGQRAKAEDLAIKVQAGEALAARDAVYVSTADGKAYKCDADDSTKLGFVGFVQEAAILNADVFIVYGHLGGFTGLTAGADYYLSSTAGLITSTKTPTAILVGTAINTTTIKIESILSQNVTEFSANGTWTKPARGQFALIELWGGGGSGGVARGTGNPFASAAAGGGGGEYVSCLIPLAYLAASYAITIGAGGAARVISSNTTTAGLAGGTTSFGSLVTALGGAGGGVAGGTTTATTGNTSNISGGIAEFLPTKTESGGFGGGGTGNASTSTATAGQNKTYASSGGGGAAGQQNATPASASAAGGTSTYGGNGGAGAANSVGNATAVAGAAKGGGGGGAIGSNTGTITSGAGGNGFCRVTVF